MNEQTNKILLDILAELTDMNTNHSVTFQAGEEVPKHFKHKAKSLITTTDNKNIVRWKE